jgi:23S rRNA pseudouridine1911/1915/1917 synthase
VRSEKFSNPDEYVVTHLVPQGYEGVRLDAFLKERYRKRSRVQVQKAIETGAITIIRNQSPHLMLGKLKASSALYPGDEIHVLSERKPEPPVNFDYQVIHEDEHFLIINKPANLPVHPAGRYFFNTLLVHLRTQGHKDPLKTEREFFLVHRIDKETSGVLVLAKQREICANLVRQFAERETEKQYLAVVRGVPEKAEFSVDFALRRAVGSLIDLKMQVAPESEGGQASLTRFERLSVHQNSKGAFTLLRCFPKTGRQHQIRVHLEAVGHPIVGDKLYGRDEKDALSFYERRWLSPEAEAKLLLPRHALHAEQIRFKHPLTQRWLEFRSPLPKDLQAFLDNP